MPLTSIESSALVKRYVQEQGSDVIDELFDDRRPDETFALSLLAVVELRSALLRLAKGGKISELEAVELLNNFRKDVSSVKLWVHVDDSLLDEAAIALERHPLRTGDALHFASMLRLRSVASGAGEIFLAVTSNGELKDACRAEGINTLDPAQRGALDQIRMLRRR
ncbi:MAG: type II toxin-antitoxin system VapC family toxin [Chloroflexi bacterium]|nr:type II toxin-antitoxin system VapC family toxin [Chloroflexota bacterium]